MKQIRIMAIITALAVMVAIFLGVTTVNTITSTEEQARINRDTAVPVVVATAAIPAYTPITAEMLTIASIPEKYVTASYMRSVDDVIGKLLVNDVPAGQQIVPNMILGDVDSGILADALKEGERAITVSVSDETGLSQMVKHGDRLTVLSTKAESESGTVKSEVLFTGVRVIALGASVSPYAASPDGYSNITLALSPEQVTRLDAAEKSGMIRFIMESSTENPDLIGKEVAVTDSSNGDAFSNASSAAGSNTQKNNTTSNTTTNTTNTTAN